MQTFILIMGWLTISFFALHGIFIFLRKIIHFSWRLLWRHDYLQMIAYTKNRREFELYQVERRLWKEWSENQDRIKAEKEKRINKIRETGVKITPRKNPPRN